jgi:hypothetical protein
MIVPEDGTLPLGINDNALSDNCGALFIRVLPRQLSRPFFLLSQPHFNLMFVTGHIRRDKISLDFFPVYHHFDYAFADTIRIMDDDSHQLTPEPASCQETIPI